MEVAVGDRNGEKIGDYLDEVNPEHLQEDYSTEARDYWAKVEALMEWYRTEPSEVRKSSVNQTAEMLADLAVDEDVEEQTRQRAVTVLEQYGFEEHANIRQLYDPEDNAALTEAVSQHAFNENREDIINSWRFHPDNDRKKAAYEGLVRARAVEKFADIGIYGAILSDEKAEVFKSIAEDGEYADLMHHARWAKTHVNKVFDAFAENDVYHILGAISAAGNSSNETHAGKLVAESHEIGPMKRIAFSEFNRGNFAGWDAITQVLSELPYVEGGRTVLEEVAERNESSFNDYASEILEDNFTS